jgi:hypothetical protein
MPDIVQTVSPLGGAPTSGNAAPGAAAARPVINQTFSHGGDTARTESTSSPVIEQKVRSGGEAGSSMLSESTRKMLDNLDKYGSVLAPKDAPADPPAEQKTEPAAATPAAETKPAAPAGTPEPEKPAAQPQDDYRGISERLTNKNRELLSEIESLKARPSRELNATEKALQKAYSSYWDDSVGAVRQFLAVVHGHEDPAHKDIDSELSGLYQDLTARELNVPLDKNEQAIRESARTRQILAREKRERQAEQTTSTAPPDDPEAKLLAEHTQIVGNRLSSRLADGKTVADAYPLTSKFAEQLNGQKPAALILAVIREGVRTGEIDVNDHNDSKIEQAAKKIEAHYQALADMFDEARKPATSTATPTPAADAKANQEQARNQVGRPITNASASVAPATPPAKQPEKPDAELPRSRKRPGETEDMRRARILKDHFGD